MNYTITIFIILNYLSAEIKRETEKEWRYIVSICKIEYNVKMKSRLRWGRVKGAGAMSRCELEWASVR